LDRSAHQRCGVSAQPGGPTLGQRLACFVEHDVDPADGGRLLHDVRTFIRRFCVLPDAHCLTAVTLWAAHTHMVQSFHTTPRLILSSPEAGSGKTRVLEILDLLVPESLFTCNASPAAIFRTLSAKQITLLFDEVDAIWSKRGQDDTHEDLRSLLNAGYKRGASIPRCVGPHHDVKSFPVFCAVALAGLGDLPDTIMTRAVIVRMRRRAPGETLEPFRLRTHEPEGRQLRERLAAWAAGVGEIAGNSWPNLPEGVADRPAEVWEPLLAVADSAGGKWPTVAREACSALCKVAEDRRVSLGVRLLSDLRSIFGDANAMHTETVIERLVCGDTLDEDAPWSDLHGKSLGKRALASMLAKYGVKPTKVRIGARVLQGYRRADLWDAWVRYLPQAVSAPASPEHAEQTQSRPAKLVAATVPAPVPGVPDVPEFPQGRGALGDAEVF
jgi:hypothetical protein